MTIEGMVTLRRTILDRRLYSVLRELQNQWWMCDGAGTPSNPVKQSRLSNFPLIEGSQLKKCALIRHSK